MTSQPVIWLVLHCPGRELECLQDPPLGPLTEGPYTSLLAAKLLVRELEGCTVLYLPRRYSFG